MNKSDTHAFVNQLLVYTLVMICLSGSIGLGTVWLRHQISVTANQTKQMEARILETERRLAEVNARIAAETSAEALARRNREWALGLGLPTEPQVVRVTERVEERLARRSNAEIFRDEPGVTPVRFNLGGQR
jgi:hypothetical protein